MTMLLSAAESRDLVLEHLAEIDGRVRSTICPTFSARGETVEGRISQADYEALRNYLAAAFPELRSRQ
jgi:hypothetical protein